MSGTAGGTSAGPGTWGTNEFVEPYVRRLVAEHLGVGAEELVSHVSLRADLAADSLDLVELAVALEGEFAIAVPETVFDDVHTYGDLVRATARLIRARSAETGGVEAPARVWLRLTPATGRSVTLERTVWLTPYTAETIGEDAVRAGPGARLELRIATHTPEVFLRAQRQFAGLGKRGVLVSIAHRGEDEAAHVPGLARRAPMLADSR